MAAQIPPPPPHHANNRSRHGSTIVGVLAALVFIGIVIAAMLRNTGSQSVVSVGYGTMSTMSSTINSGFIAAESLIENQNNADNIVRLVNDAMGEDAPQAYVDTATAMYLIGNKRERLKLGEKQYFSSRISKLVKGESKGDNIYGVNAAIEVKTGINNGGKALKRGIAFGVMEGMVMNYVAGGGKPKNAFFSGGSVPAGNGGMKITGNATIEGDLTIQNRPYVFNSTLWVSGNLNLNSSGVGGSSFNDKVYVGENVIVQQSKTNAPLFNSDVGVDGNVLFGGNSFTMNGNLWTNGKLLQNSTSGYTGGLTFEDGKTIHYTDKFGSADINWSQVAGTPVRDSITTGIFDSIPKKNLNMGTIEDRREPPIPSEVVTAMDRNAIDLYDIFPDGNNINGSALDTYYNEHPDRLYNDHLVIKVKPPNTNFNSSNAGQFTKKAIFILEDGVTGFGSSGFFSSGDESSIMVYAKPGATLDLVGQGDFRGLIYVDPNNTSNHTVSFPQGSTITGGVHLLGSGNLTWNTGSGSSNDPINIVFNEAVINGFYPPTGTQVTQELDANTGAKKNIWFRSIGYYYY